MCKLARPPYCLKAASLHLPETPEPLASLLPFRQRALRHAACVRAGCCAARLGARAAPVVQGCAPQARPRRQHDPLHAVHDVPLVQARSCSAAGRVRSWRAILGAVLQPVPVPLPLPLPLVCEPACAPPTRLLHPHPHPPSVRRQKSPNLKTQCSACHGNRDNVYGGPYAGVICGNCLWTRFGGWRPPAAVACRVWAAA